MRGGCFPLRLLSLLCGAGAAAAATAAGEPDPPILEEIVVVGTRTERPLKAVAAAVTTFDRERLDWEQAQNLGDLARYEPALEAEYASPRFGDSGIAIRGIGGNRVAIEFDGVPLPQQFAVGNFADSSRLVVDPAIVRRVEILRGPASALYGSDAIGGVVALSSVDPGDLVRQGRSLYAGTGAGWFGADGGILVHGTLAHADGNDGFLASFSRRDGEEADNEARGVPDDRVEASQWQVFGKWSHDFGSGGTLRASGDAFQRDVESDVRSILGFGRFANSLGITGDDRQESSRAVAQYAIGDVVWLDEFAAQGYVQSNDTLQRTDERRFSGAPALLIERDFSMREDGHGAEFRARRDIAGSSVEHSLTAGGDWDRQKLTQARDGRQTVLATGGVSNVILGEVFPLRDMPETVVNEIGLYAQDEIRWGRFMLVPGLRWDRFDLDARTDDIFTDPDRLTDLENDELSLRFGAVFGIDDRLSIYAQYADGFRAPPPADVNLFLDIPLFNIRAIPNPDLKPETSGNFEGGVRWGSAGTYLEAAAYYSRYDDFIESRVPIGTDPASGTLLFQSRNLEEATIYGVELKFSQVLDVLHAALADWSIEGGLHWAHGENDVTDEPLNAVSPLKGIFNLYWEPARWPLRAGLRIRHYAHQDRVDFSAGEFFVPPSATAADFSLRWTPSPRMNWQLSLNNLGDARYWLYADVRRLAPDDPRVEIASQPGFHADLTFTLAFQ
jgi:hemoglobin/transferrin/lactoferrin receptor protein